MRLSSGLEWDDISTGRFSTESRRMMESALMKLHLISMPWKGALNFTLGRIQNGLGFLELSSMTTI